ncbi:MAG: hypothetical protein GX383_06170 [Clostridium sp.]|mgnify:CR=1 FL=1|jgi:hypothetical protein|nr:hypothetical protein [Clostridium sp.]
MKKSKLGIVMLISALLLVLGGCNNIPGIDKTGESNALPSSTADITVTSSVTPVTLTSLTLEEQSIEAYEKFMKNEMKVSFDRFVKNEYTGETLFEAGSEYSLSELLHLVTDHYLEYSTNKKIGYIDYSYIDCGKDGVNELALRFNGIDIYYEDDDSTLVYIIKYIDGKLSVCYYYETWVRSDSAINKYGYYKSSGSGGASNHGEEYGLIDKDGNWHFIASIESELDINQLAWSDELKQIPETAETKGISGNIELITLCFDKSVYEFNTDEVGHKERFYTFNVYDDNWELIEDENLYTNSIYKEIFDEASVPFITPDEVSDMISEKEKEVGATAEIKEGSELTWKTLDGSIFSDYVER